MPVVRPLAPGTRKEEKMTTRTDEHLETDLRLEGRQQKRLQDEKAYGPGENIYLQIQAEVARAARHGEHFASLHEAYAVMLEEVDEVWDIARQKRRDRDELELRKELIQIAAMVVKALASIENFVGGNV
jgi:hypothetical protein